MLKSYIMLSPDAVGAAEVDPLDQDVGGIDTSFPLLSPGLYDMEITEASVGHKKDDPSREVLTIKFVTTLDSLDVKGEILHKGYPIFYRTGLTPTEDMPAKKVATNLARILKVCGFKSGVSPRQLTQDPKMVVGRVVRCKVKVQKETDDYPASNSISQFVDVE